MGIFNGPHTHYGGETGKDVLETGVIEKLLNSLKVAVANSIDTTLTIAGRLADAKAVGDRIKDINKTVVDFIANFKTDTTLTKVDIAADAKAVGDNFTQMGEDVNNRFTQMGENVDNRFTQMGENVDNRFAQMSEHVNNEIAQMGEQVDNLDYIATVNGKAPVDGELTLSSTDVGAAPSGHGLGVATDGIRKITKEELDTTTKAGWYEYYNASVVACGYDGTNYGGVLVIPSMWSVTQFFFCRMHYGGYLKRIKQNDAEWSAWEWVNPPMILEIEYRTVERWQGEAVYAKLINFGSLPNAAQKQLNINVGASQIIHASAVTSLGAYIPFDYYKSASLNYKMLLAVDKSSVSIRTEHDASSETAIVFIKYVKE